MVRYAFTMIELIFALVIMGIVFITLPLILINDSSNVEQNLMQEAIFASSAKLGQILTYTWDENSPDPGTVLTASNVVTTPLAAPQLNRVGTSDFRIGHFEQSLHRRMTPNSVERFASTVLGKEAGDLDDIDDFNGDVNLDLIAATSVGGYKKAYRVTTTVSYISDAVNYSTNDINFTFDVTAGVANPSNIKMIEMTTDQNNSDGWSALPILRLRTFSANIGETDFYKRTY